MVRRVVLYLAGGGMTGVFSAGVMKRLQELDFYEQLDAVYAVSAGAMNGAYFLARQSELLEQIYTQELASDDFVHMARILTRSDNVINIDYVAQVVREKHKLSLTDFQSQSIPLYAKVLNTATDDVEYLDARDYGVFPVLQATASIAPFYKGSTQINECNYIDGAIKESIGLARIKEKHPDAAIVVVVNTPFRSGLKGFLNNLWRKLVLYAACDKHLYNLFKESDRMEERDIKEALAAHNIFLIYPPADFPVFPSTTNMLALKAGYEMGYEVAAHMAPFLEKDVTPWLPTARLAPSVYQPVAA